MTAIRGFVYNFPGWKCALVVSVFRIDHSLPVGGEYTSAVQTVHPPTRTDPTTALLAKPNRGELVSPASTNPSIMVLYRKGGHIFY